MTTKTFPHATPRRVDWRCNGWLTLLTLLCLMTTHVLADGRQSTTTISVTAAEGSEGSRDAADPGIFTIQCGAYDAEQPTEFFLTLNEAAAYPVSVELRMVGTDPYYSCPISIDDGEPTEGQEHTVVTFAPGQTSKKISFTHGIAVEDLVYSAPTVGRRPFYIELLYPSRATLDVRLVEFVYTPITKITADIGETSVEFTNLNLLPGESANLAGYFAIDTNNYDGQEQMEVTAQFGGMNIALARRRAPSADASSYASAMMAPLVRRTIMPRSQATAARAMRRAATDPTMTATATIDMTIEATDLSCTVLSNRIKDTRNTVIAKVVNCSPLPLLAGQTVTAGLYATAADTEPIEGTATVTIPVTDLFDSGQPRTKVISLQAADLPADQQAIIKVVVSSADGAPVADVHPENNHVPVPLYAQDGNIITLLGDVNRDGQVDAADTTTLAMHLVGIALPVFAEEAADANGDGRITVADISAIVSICIR